jgi:hypothetical protein
MAVRRLASYGLDLAIVAAPWLAILGLAIVPPRGGDLAGIGFVLALAALCTLGSLALLVLQATLFLLRGRTLGMASVGLEVESGSRALSLFLGAMVPVVPFGAVALLSSGMDGASQRLLGAGVPLVAMGLELGPSLGAGARTLTDRLAGIRWTRSAGTGVPGLAPFFVDALVLVVLGAPPLFVVALDWNDAAGPLTAGAVGTGLFVLLELIVVAMTQGTVGMRALARRPR